MKPPTAPREPVATGSNRYAPRESRRRFLSLRSAEPGREDTDRRLAPRSDRGR